MSELILHALHFSQIQVQLLNILFWIQGRLQVKELLGTIYDRARGVQALKKLKKIYTLGGI